MKDSVTRDSIVVNTDGTAGPYIFVPPDKADAVRNILEANGHWFVIDRDAPRSDVLGSHSCFNLGNGADVDAIQHLLDDAE